VKHNDNMISAIHRQTGTLLTKITGEPLFPSYSYLSAYLEGAELRRHVDRPQCQWNGSMLIDAVPEHSLEGSWPIFLETSGGVHEIRLDLGDTVIYRGQEVPHWRNQLPVGDRQTLALFHYVRTNFTGSLD
jgi:hypothetical protein